MTPDGASRVSIFGQLLPELFSSPLSGWRAGILHAGAPARAEVESTRIDIAARVSSRLAKVPVARRQDAAAGATLMLMDNPELVAQLNEAEAETLVGDAALARVNVGARAEIIAQRKGEIDRAAA